MTSYDLSMTFIMGKVFKNGPSKICGRQPLKNLLSPLLNTLSYLFQQTSDALGLALTRILQK